MSLRPITPNKHLRNKFLEYEYNKSNAKITTYTINSIIGLNSSQNYYNKTNTQINKTNYLSCITTYSKLKTPSKHQQISTRTINDYKTIIHRRGPNVNQDEDTSMKPQLKLGSNRRASILLRQRPKALDVPPLDKGTSMNKMVNSLEVDLLVKLANEKVNTPNKAKKSSKTIEFTPGSNRAHQTLFDKYKLDSIRLEMKVIKKKVKLIKGIFDYTCPKLFVTKNEIEKKTRKNEIEIKIKRKQSKKNPIKLYDCNIKQKENLTQRTIDNSNEDYIQARTLYNLKHNSYFYNRSPQQYSIIKSNV